MRKRIKLIANPVSGGDSRSRIARVQHFLEADGAQVELIMTGQRGDASAAAALVDPGHCDLVIAAGGDGTLNEVANGLAGRGVPLAFVPLGTANVMALEMGIPLALKKACRVALEGEVRPVALARTEKGCFLMMAGVGFDAAAVRMVNSRLKRHIGKFAYLIAGIKALARYRAEPFVVESGEGERFKAWHAVICNIQRYGGHYIMAPQAGLGRWQLSACLVDRPGRFALLLFWLRVLLRDRVCGPIRRVESRSFHLSGMTQPVQIDGDEDGNLPLRVEKIEGLLEMVFPFSTS